MAGSMAIHMKYESNDKKLKFIYEVTGVSGYLTLAF